MASAGDTMKIAVAIQDLTKEGLKRIEQNLRKIPSSIGIDVKSTMGDFKAIKKLKKDMVEAGAQAGLLNGALDKVGKGTLSGLLADAKRFERNMKVVRESIAKIGELGNKADSNKLLSRFSGFDKGTQIAAITNFRNKMADVRAELDKLNRTPRSTKSWNTEKIAQHREQVRALTAEYNRYDSVVRRMDGILSRQASEAKRFHSQQQQSLRTIDSAFARNSGAFQRAYFDDYLRSFKIMPSDKRVDEIVWKRGLRDDKAKELANAQSKLQAINPSDTQAIARQVQVVAHLRAEYSALNSELKRLRAAHVQLNDAERRANTKAIQQRLRAERQEAKRAQQEQKKALQESKQAATQYRAELNNVQVAMRGTSQFASQLREDIQQAFSYYALKQFLSNLIEIGGQFEYQRRAIANILQDTTKANTLFNQIKELGLKSPFSTLELDSYAKQLSAFDIPYHKMYDTLKKMADIAAGTGADMSRIILAYGHVKSEGFLTGIQRRQFSNANINIVGGLADYYSKQEGQQVTKRDVYKRIHDKQVTFEDMDTVLMSMAEEGGQFHNMQEVMASTVKGTYKNLTDAINHMYMAIEKSANGPLMFFGKTLTSIIKLAESFPGAATRFVMAATAMAGIRALNISRMGKEAEMTVKRIMLLDKERIAMDKNAAIYGKNSIFQGQGLTKKSTENLANLMRQNTLEGQATKQAVLRGIAHRKINMETANQLVVLKAITQEELKAAAAARGLGATIKAGAMSVFATLKAGITSLLASVWPMLAIWGVVEAGMWAWNKLMGTEEEERKKAMIQSLADSYNSLKREMDGLPESFDNMYTDEVFQSIKDMVDAIKNELADSEIILGRVFEKDANGGYLKNTYDQAVALRQEMERALGVKEDIFKKDLAHNFTPLDVSGGPLIGGYGNFHEFWGKVKEGKQNYDKALLEAIKKPNFQEWAKGYKKDHEGLTDFELAKRYLYRTSDTWAHDAKEKGERYGTLESNFNTYLKALGTDWIGKAKAFGYTDDLDIMSVLSTALSLQTDLDDSGKKYVMDYFTKTFFPKQYKGTSDGNVQVPNAIYDKIMAKLGEMKDEDKIRLRSFNIQRTGSLADYYDAFKKDYKDLRGKMEEAYKKNDYLDFVDAEMLKKPTKITETFDDPIKKQAVENWNKDVERYTTLLAAAKIAGYDEADLKEEKKGRGGGSQKDQWLEDQQVWFDTLKKAAKLYKDNAKYFGTEEAFDKISSMPEFKDVLSGMSEETLAQLARTLEKYLADNSKNFTTDDRKKFRNRVAQEQGELDLADLKDNQTRWIREADKYMSDQLQRYDIYTKMYNATGSHSTAQQFAFGTEGLRQNYGDFVKATFNSKFAERGLDYDTLAGWTEEQWKTEEGEEIRKTFEDAKKSIEQWKKSMNEAYINLLKNGKSYERITKNIQAQYEEDVTAIENSDASQEDKNKMTAEAEARRDLALVDAKLTDLNFDKNFTSFNKQDFHLLALEIAMAIDKAFETGAIDRETYNERKSSLMRMTRDYKSANSLPFVDSTTQAFIKGGLPGYFEKVKQDWEVAQGKAAKDESYKETAEYKKAEKRAKKVFGKDTEDDGEGGWKGANDAVQAFTDSLVDGAGKVQSVAGVLEGAFSALGMGGAADVAKDVGTLAGGVQSGASAMKWAGPWGEAAGAALGAIGAIGKMHDNRLNKKIQKSQRYVKQLAHEYEKLDRQMERSFTIDNNDALEQYESLHTQITEIEKQIQWEIDKKETDWGWVEDAERQIEDIQEQIKYYYKEVWSELYGLDLKEYGDRLGQSLIEAFQKGEDAAIAWKRTVGDIVRELAGELIKQKFIMPKLEQAYNQLFGVDGNGGILGGNVEITQDKIEQVGNILNDAFSENDIQKAELLYDWFEEKFPYSNVDESVGGLSKIGTSLTEETGSVIAAYINTIRADVSYNRKHIASIVERGLPAIENINVISQAQLSQLQVIAGNTEANARAAESILNILQSATNGTKTFWVK